MRYYIGVDWGNQEHAIWVEDEAGTKVLSRRLAERPEAFAEWGRWLDEQRSAGIELWAGIERPEGRVVDFLLDHGVVVFPLNPKALDRARDRFRMSGAKSDDFDARVAANMVRPDHAHLTPLRPSSEAAQELKALTRDYARQVRQQTRLLNQLTITLKEYYPRPDAPTPPIYQNRIEALVHQKFPDEYDAVRGIVRTRRPLSVRQKRVEMATMGMDDVFAKFFAKKNPGYLQGDYLVCIADLSPTNRTRLGQKFIAFDDA